MNALLIKYDRCLWFVILPYFPMQKYKLICNILIFSMLFPIIYMKRDKLGTKFIQK